MGQRSRYHLELAKEEKGDEMGWHNRQDLLSLSPGGGEPRSPPDPQPKPVALHLPGVLEVSTKAPQGLASVLESL